MNKEEAIKILKHQRYQEKIKISRGEWFEEGERAMVALYHDQSLAIIELLEKAIIPKYQIGQVVWSIIKKRYYRLEGGIDLIMTNLGSWFMWYHGINDEGNHALLKESELFPTEAEALASLQKGNNE